MIVLSNLAAQTIQPGQAVTFDKVIFQSGCGECYNRQLPKSVQLKTGSIYELAFSGNVTSDTAAAVLQMSIAIGGEPLVETAMNSVPAAAGDLNNISTETRFGVSCSGLRSASVINTGAVPVILAPNSAFVVERKGCSGR